MERKQLLRGELITILETMEVPFVRLAKLDLGWLNRNLHFRNKNHPSFERAKEIIKELLCNHP